MVREDLTEQAVGARSGPASGTDGGDRLEIFAIGALAELLAEPIELLGVDEALAEGDLLGAADLDALTLLQGADKLASLKQAVGSSGVEPGIAPDPSSPRSACPARDKPG